MQKSSDSQTLVDQFLQSGGQIQKVPPCRKTVSEKRYREAAKAEKERIEALRAANGGS